MDAFPLRLSIRSIDDRSQERQVPYSAVQGSKQTWLQSMRIYLNNWKDAACDRACWRWTVKEVIERTDVKRHQKAEEGDCLKNCSTTFFSPGPQLAQWYAQPNKTLQHHQRLTRAHQLCLSRLCLPMMMMKMMMMIMSVMMPYSKSDVVKV